MQTGSIVQCVSDFSHLAKIWGIAYPKKGEILIVASVTEHPNEEVRSMGIVLVRLEEYPNHPTGICDKNTDGSPNIVELMPPINLPIKELFPEEQFA